MIILIQEPPGSGKSQIGTYLSALLSIPFYSKDEVKEILFDSLGTSDTEWSKKLAVCANQILFEQIRKTIFSSKDLIVETNISLTSDIETVTKIFNNRSAELTEIYITARKEVLLDRVKKRWNSGSRHHGHADNDRLVAIEKYIDDAISKPIRLGQNVIELDSSEITIAELKNKVKLELQLNGIDS